MHCIAYELYGKNMDMEELYCENMDMEESNLRGWQMDLRQYLDKPCNRKIIWVVGVDGKEGKAKPPVSECMLLTE